MAAHPWELAIFDAHDRWRINPCYVRESIDLCKPYIEVCGEVYTHIEVYGYTEVYGEAKNMDERANIGNWSQIIFFQKRSY